MHSSWTNSKFYDMWIFGLRLCYVSLLWFMFTIAGLVVFGIIPATVAMFTIFRKWLRGEREIEIFRTYLQSIKKDFLKVNIIGLIFAVAAYILYFNYQFLGLVNGMQHTVLQIGWFAGMAVFLITLLYVFPAYVHYELKLSQYLKTAFLIGFASPVATITLSIAIVLTLYLLTLVPGVIPFFGPSFIGFLIMWTAYKAFERIDAKKESIAV